MLISTTSQYTVRNVVPILTTWSGIFPAASATPRIIGLNNTAAKSERKHISGLMFFPIVLDERLTVMRIISSYPVGLYSLLFVGPIH